MSEPRYQLELDKIHTLVDLFDARVAKSPSLPAYRQFLPGVERWHSYSWNDISSRVRAWEAALSRENLEAGARVAIMSSNRPDWIAADIACLSLGLVVVALFNEDTPGNAAATLAHAEASFLIVEEPQSWVQMVEADPLPLIQRVVAITADSSQLDARLVSLTNFLQASEGDHQPRLRHERPKPEDLAVICYTSGTSGRPKGAMLTHRNILSNVIACHAVIPMREGDVVLSFLPLAHMFERTAGYYHAMLAGADVAFTRGIAHLSDDFREVRPTVIVSVPRVFERFYALIQRRIGQHPWLFRKLFAMAIEAGWQAFEYRQKRGPMPRFAGLWRRVDAYFGQMVLSSLGGNMRLAVSGGAPLSPEIARCFISLGLPIVQGYGLTEASPVVSSNREDDNDPESVGLPLPGVETRRSSTGELQVRGPNVMRGYWRDPEATAAVLCEDGWLSTGDKISRLQSERLYVIGRIKELIVMSNGEKAAPGLLEQDLLLDALVDQVIVVGEARPYLAALIVPNADAFRGFLAEHKLTRGAMGVEALLLERLQRNLGNQPKFAQIRHVAVIDEPWTIDNEMLTPTQKPRRARIKQHHAEQIEAMYRGHFRPDDTGLNYHVDLG